MSKTRYPGIDDLGDGRFRVRVYDPRTRGYLQRRVTGLKAARQLQARLKAEVQSGEGRPTGRVPTVKEFGESWRTQLIHAPGSARDLEQDLRLHIYPELGSYAVDRVGHRQALGFVQRLVQSDLAEATQGKIDTHVRALFRAVVADRWRERSPFEDVARIEVSRRARRRVGEYVPSLAEAIKIADLAKEDGRLYMWAWIRLLAGTGLRGGEACGLAVEELDYPQPTRIALVQQLQYGNTSMPYFLAPPKSEAGARTVPLAPWVAETLAVLNAAVEPFQTTLPWVERGRVRDDRSTTLLFSGRYGPAPLNETVAARAVRALAKRAGLPNRVTPHSLRRTYTTVLHDAGVPVKVIDHVTGHESDGLTLGTYTEVTAAALERARSAIADAYDQAIEDRDMSISCPPESAKSS